jgi:hypothetical protein
MTALSMRALKLVLVLLIVAIGQIISADMTNTPHLGSGVVLLQVTEPSEDTEPTFFSELSSWGNFVVSRIDHYERGVYTNSSLDAWDMQQWAINDGLTRPQPTTTASIDTAPLPPDFAISPDERYVAIQVGNELQILSLPALNSYFAISSDSDQVRDLNVVSWSPDSQYVGALFTHEIVVWEVETDNVYRQAIEYLPIDSSYYQFMILNSISQGWLIHQFYSHPSLAFIFCDWLLTSCQSYEFTNTDRVVAMPDGSVILTQHTMPPTADGAVGVWIRQESGGYILQEETLDSEVCPTQFSPSGLYLYSYWSEQILNFNDLTPLNRVVSFRAPIWLPQESHFVSLTLTLSLNLYQLDDDDPLQTLDLLSSYQEILEGLLHSEALTIAINQVGDWILVDLGHASILVPITYE